MSTKSKSDKAKERYKSDPEFREKVLNRAKKRYWDRRTPTSELSSEERSMLAQMNSYPVLGPGNLGTSEPTTNLKVVIVHGQERIKGALFLEQYKKDKKIKCS